MNLKEPLYFSSQQNNPAPSYLLQELVRLDFAGRWEDFYFTTEDGHQVRFHMPDRWLEDQLTCLRKSAKQKDCFWWCALPFRTTSFPEFDRCYRDK